MQASDEFGRKFDSGRYIRCQNVSEYLDGTQEFELFTKHVSGGWDFVSDEQKKQNEAAANAGEGEVISEFSVSEGKKVRFRTTIGYKTAVIVVNA